MYLEIGAGLILANSYHYPLIEVADIFGLPGFRIVYIVEMVSDDFQGVRV